MTDYDAQYQKSWDVCGPPFQEFVAFFERYPKRGARVLDLGCGQGRDALFIARLGHRVLGVDISPTGIAHMLEDANAQRLDVDGVVADLVDYETHGEYDVVILDRVLHMLENDKDRLAVLGKASAAAASGGFVLIADTPKHLGLIRSFFERASEDWTRVADKKGILFLQKR